METKERKEREKARAVFSNHVAAVRVDANDVMVIEWRDKSGSCLYYAQYIIDMRRGLLVVSGDLGYCLSDWGNALKVEKLVNFVQNVSYWIGKFKASSDCYTYKAEDIKEDLMEMRDEYIQNKSDYDLDYPDDKIIKDFDELSDILCDNWNGEESLPQDAIDIIKTYDADWWDGHEWIFTGRRICSRVYLWSEGLKMAFEQLALKKKEENCFISNGEAYPLCKGTKAKKCHDCCLYEDYESYHAPF